MGRPDTSFFTISDSKYFVGTVALVNSLRISGHDEPVTVLDCGFTTPQRAILDEHCRLVPFVPADVGSASPAWMKAYPHVVGAEGSIVIIDSDAVVTGPLDEIFDASDRGQISAIAGAMTDRWFPEWEQLFGLSTAPRRQTYVSAAFVAFSTRRWPRLLADWWSACEATWSKPDTRGRVSEVSKDPLKLLDQDVLNGLLMTEVSEEALNAISRARGPAGTILLEECSVENEGSLQCTCKGERTLIVHHSGGRFPWRRDPRVALRKWSPAYVTLLRRLLWGSDVPIRIPVADVPVWLRPGIPGVTMAGAVSSVARARYDRRRARRARAATNGARDKTPLRSHG